MLRQPTLLVDILRGEWGFDGHVVSDCGALDDMHETHGLTADAAESAALAVHRGCDLECGYIFQHLGEALARGLLNESDIDRAMTQICTTRFKLGMFDPPEQVPFASIPESVINCAAHRALAHEAAVKSIVLLKNEDNILPLQQPAQDLRARADRRQRRRAAGQLLRPQRIADHADRGHRGAAARGRAPGVSPRHAAAARADGPSRGRRGRRTPTW